MVILMLFLFISLFLILCPFFLLLATNTTTIIQLHSTCIDTRNYLSVKDVTLWYIYVFQRYTKKKHQICKTFKIRADFFLWLYHLEVVVRRSQYGVVKKMYLIKVSLMMTSRGEKQKKNGFLAGGWAVRFLIFWEV